MILKIGYKLEDIDFIKEEAKYYFEKVFDVQVEECEWEAADLKLAIEKNDADLDQIHIELEKGKGKSTSALCTVKHGKKLLNIWRRYLSIHPAIISMPLEKD